MNSSNKIIFNTGVLYGQLIIQMLLGLFTTRMVLEALGETDYGIYMLVAGVVSMLGVLNSSMVGTSMRYMAYSLGGGDIELIKKNFNTVIFIHLFLGLFVVLLMEMIGGIMFEYVLNIPGDKVYDAKVVYQFMVVTTLVSIISVPYDAVMNAHEHIFFISIVDILSGILNLLLAFYLLHSTDFLLIQYGLFMFIIQVFMRLIKQLICRMHYMECKIDFRRYIDVGLMKEILSFTGWNLFGSLAAVATIQVRGIVLNSFFGVKLNAAEGVAKNASIPINMVSANLTRAMNPQLIKNEGCGNRNRMMDMTIKSAKYSICLFSLLAIPVLFEAPYLLKLWLGNVPEYAVVFCQLSLISMLIEKFSFQLTSALRAVGQIRNFQVVESVVCFIYVPIIYVLFSRGVSPVVIYVLGIGTSLGCGVVRLYFSKQILNMKIWQFIKSANLPMVLPIFLSSIVCYCLICFFQEGFLRLVIVLLLSFFTLSISFAFWGTTANEKKYLESLLIKIKNRL